MPCLLVLLPAAGSPWLVAPSLQFLPASSHCLLSWACQVSLCLSVRRTLVIACRALLHNLGSSLLIEILKLITAEETLLPYTVTFTGSRNQDLINIFGWPSLSQPAAVCSLVPKDSCPSQLQNILISSQHHQSLNSLQHQFKLKNLGGDG